MSRIHQPECASQCLAYPRDKPPAAAGCIVFVERNGVRSLARVKSFRDNVYTLQPHADGREAETKTWTIALTEDGPADGWRDAVCNDCCVCLSERANVVLECRCSMPCVCAACAEELDRCPQCREPVSKDIWLRTYGEGNIFSIGTAFGMRSVQLFVKSLLGSTWIIESFLEWSVEDFKRAFLTKTGMPMSQQRILCGGLQFADGPALRDYGVEKETTFHMVLRLTGD